MQTGWSSFPKRAATGNRQQGWQVLHDTITDHDCLVTRIDADVHWSTASIREGRLTAHMTYGLIYHVDLETGGVEIDASDAYRSDFPRRQEADPELPALEEHLGHLKGATRVWSRER